MVLEVKLSYISRNHRTRLNLPVHGKKRMAHTEHKQPRYRWLRMTS